MILTQTEKNSKSLNILKFKSNLYAHITHILNNFTYTLEYKLKDFLCVIFNKIFQSTKNSKF